jgi:hypothetical protein
MARSSFGPHREGGRVAEHADDHDPVGRLVKLVRTSRDVNAREGHNAETTPDETDERDPLSQAGRSASLPFSFLIR